MALFYIYDKLKSECNSDQVIAKKLESKIISYDRSNTMAKNLYVHGKFKTLQEEYRALVKKEKSRISSEQNRLNALCETDTAKFKNIIPKHQLISRKSCCHCENS